MVIVSLEIGQSFILPSNEYFCNQVVSSTVTVIATATAVGSPSVLFISSGNLVPVLTIVGIGVSLGHDNINFELYWSMC